MVQVLLTRLGLAVGLVFAAAGTAWAQPPITDTEVLKLTETFSDEPFLCQDELYTVSGSGHEVVHFTYFEDTGALHFHQVAHAQLVAVPLDGAGPSYVGTFRSSDSENIRAVKQGDLLVETDTDLNRVVAHVSDGSRAYLYEHAHFTVNANGETTVELSTTRMDCT
jgi:hypothetical protein